jgi:hypothetical protein
MVDSKVSSRTLVEITDVGTGLRVENNNNKEKNLNVPLRPWWINYVKKPIMKELIVLRWLISRGRMVYSACCHAWNHRRLRVWWVGCVICKLSWMWEENRTLRNPISSDGVMEHWQPWRWCCFQEQQDMEEKEVGLSILLMGDAQEIRYQTRFGKRDYPICLDTFAFPCQPISIAKYLVAAIMH